MKRNSRTIPFGVREDQGNEHPEGEELGQRLRVSPGLLFAELATTNVVGRATGDDQARPLPSNSFSTDLVEV